MHTNSVFNSGRHITLENGHQNDYITLIFRGNGPADDSSKEEY